MIQSGAMEASGSLQAVADMEDVRLRARLLALELAAMNVRYNVLGYHSMGQTELTVFLTLAATFGQTGFLVGYQVNSSEHSFLPCQVSSGKPAAFPYNGYRHRWCSDEHPGSVLPPLLNMSFSGTTFIISHAG